MSTTNTSTSTPLAADTNTVLCPEDNASWHSRVFFQWVQPLVTRGCKTPLSDDDLLTLGKAENTSVCSAMFQAMFGLCKTARRPVFKTLWTLHHGVYVLVSLLALVNSLCLLAGPLILREIVTLLQLPPEAPKSSGLWLALALFCTSLTANLAIHHLYHVTLKLGMRMRTGLVSALYGKSLRLTPEARQSSSVGTIVNLMASDAARVVNTAAIAHQLWVMPMMLLLVVTLLVHILGVSALAGIGVLALMTPISGQRARRLNNARKTLLGLSDERVSLMSEILNGIRVIKFYAWERSFKKEIESIRVQELHQLRLLAKENALVGLIFQSTPIIVGIATFSTHVLMGKDLTAPDVFSALALFGILRPVMTQLPMFISGLIDANLSCRRLEEFLTLPELEPQKLSYLTPGTVRVSNATFAWNKAKPVLNDLTFEAQKGELVVVIGAVGAGKSSLLAALLGELTCLKGAFEVAGRVAYVPQQAWILNASVRENVLFGLALAPEKLAIALKACALERDLGLLEAGIDTEIGERGVNLSGGQKQRVSLARAVCAQADVYLLDDPLSALDPLVGQAVFENCLKDLLHGKTRILVTHRLEFALQADRIVLIDDGRIVEQGKPADLVTSGGRIALLLADYQHETTLNHPPASESSETPLAPPLRQTLQTAASCQASPTMPPSPLESVPHPAPLSVPLPLPVTPSVSAPRNTAGKGRIVVDEERNVGALGKDIYLKYLKAIAPGFLFGLLLFVFVMREGLSAGADAWLAYWTSTKAASTNVFLLVFALLGCLGALATFGRSVLTGFGGVKAAGHFHRQLFEGVLRAPVSFFDSTPTGRILNRFGKDMEVIDQQIPNVLLEALACGFIILSTMVVIISATPLSIVALVPIAAIYFRIQDAFRKSSREVRRLESISRSPVYAHFSETLAGVSVIRAFGASARFMTESQRRFEGNQRAFYTMVCLNRWLGTRLELVGSLIVGSAAVSAIVMHGVVNPGLAGMAITYALMITGTLNWAVRMVSELESSLNAVERVAYYGALPAERWKGNTQVAPEWPTLGHVSIESLELRYRPGLPAVLHGLTCDINPGEKIGVVGRTGAGKSSLLLAFFRIVEPCSGRILIDGQNIQDIDLEVLRERVAIIPQDPVLFKGTIRKNLDPFSDFSDEAVWRVLERARLQDLVRSLPGHLATDVQEGGANLSVGQKQLLCLARALLKRARVLLVDEATANVDFETDSLIQKVIREEFANCTVLTIAHRLSTVLDADRILVLDAGGLVEFDTPARLLALPGGKLAEMVQAGQVSHMAQMAQAENPGVGLSAESAARILASATSQGTLDADHVLT